MELGEGVQKTPHSLAPLTTTKFTTSMGLGHSGQRRTMTLPHGPFDGLNLIPVLPFLSNVKITRKIS